MEASSASRGGKVKGMRATIDASIQVPTKDLVEYCDPSGVYPLVASDFQRHLPLRNLHWNSPSRPLRSIESLYVEVVPDEKTNSSGSVLKSVGGGEQDVGGIKPAARRPSEAPSRQRERRHQIPGLRETPYLKIYFLRCDDVDTYKSTSRKLLREWIKTSTLLASTSTSVNNPESHDAFEWMIVHVVLPDVQSSSIWPNKASTGVLDRIRADFNGSSKSSVDRVAQIPSVKNLQVQGVTINPIPSGPGREPFLQESSRAWEDLLAKTKSLILTSFDLRVQQYEEDIKEKGAQRSLPGWNFCTFFVLKEGLARGFDNVGLVEDALMGYDELAVELDDAIRDQKEKTLRGEHAGLFRDHTQELLVQAESALQRGNLLALQSSDQASDRVEHLDSVIDAERKPYRDLILANNISTFDFQSYVFARQLSLLLRISRLSPLAAAFASRGTRPGRGSSEQGQPAGKEPADMMIIADICQRAIRFITSTGSIIRDDLRASFNTRRDADEASQGSRFSIIENIIASWTFTACHQVLATAGQVEISKLMVLYSKDGILVEGNAGDNQSSAVVRPSSLSSLPHRTSSRLHNNPLPSIPPDADLEDASLYEPAQYAHNQTQHGLRHLASQRASLHLIARKALSSIGRRQGWTSSWSQPSKIRVDELEEISLEHSTQIVEENEAPGVSGNPEVSKIAGKECSSSILAGILDSELRVAVSSSATFYVAYEEMTWAAFRLYRLSGDANSSHAMTADVALVRFILEDYSAATKYFRQLAPSYVQDSWNDLELSILDMYARCLMKLDSMAEYVKVSLKLVARTCTLVRQQRGLSSPFTMIESGDVVNASEYLRAVLRASEAFTEPFKVPISDYFTDVQMDPFIRHVEHRDGFEMVLKLYSLLSEDLDVQQVRVRLVNAAEGNSREILLCSEEHIQVQRGSNQIALQSKVLLPDWYLVDQISIQSSGILFEQHPLRADLTSTQMSGRDSISSTKSTKNEIDRIYVWPSPRSFALDAAIYSHIHLERQRCFVLHARSGHNSLLSGVLTIKAASAGLRIHTGRAQIIEGVGELVESCTPGNITLPIMAPETSIKIRIPYGLENEAREISVRTEVSYLTEHGDFLFGANHKLSALLPLGVNVQDIFTRGALFSRFAMSSSTSIPLRLVKCDLQGTSDFETSTPRAPDHGLYIISQQAISMVYRIVPTKATTPHTRDSRLSMNVDYVCLDEEVIAVVVGAFETSLAGSDFELFTRFLIPFLSAYLRSSLTRSKLEKISLLGEIEMGTFDQFRWQKHLESLARQYRLSLGTWLREWHEVGLKSSGRADQAYM